MFASPFISKKNNFFIISFIILVDQWWVYHIKDKIVKDMRKKVENQQFF